MIFPTCRGMLLVQHERGSKNFYPMAKIVLHIDSRANAEIYSPDE